MNAIQTVTLQSFPVVVTANRAVVDFANVIPGVGASAAVRLGTEDEDGNFVPAHSGSYTVAMTPEQYALWGTDDAYAVECFLTNLGAVLA